MSELPYLLTAAPSKYPRGALSLLGADFMPTPLSWGARVGYSRNSESWFGEK